MSDDPDGFALVVMTLSQEDGSGPTLAAIADARSTLREAADGAATTVRTFDLIPEVNGRWSGGGIDVLRFDGEGELATAATSAVGARRAQSLPGTATCRIFATRAFPVRPGPTTGIHLFAQGHYLAGYTRAAGQARWRQHARLLVTTRWYEELLLGYTQFHGYDHEDALALGIDDTNGIAHITHESVEARRRAMEHPEHIAVLGPDDDEFMARDRGMRVFTVETTDGHG